MNGPLGLNTVFCTGRCSHLHFLEMMKGIYRFNLEIIFGSPSIVECRQGKNGLRQVLFTGHCKTAANFTIILTWCISDSGRSTVPAPQRSGSPQPPARQRHHGVAASLGRQTHRLRTRPQNHNLRGREDSEGWYSGIHG